MEVSSTALIVRSQENNIYVGQMPTKLGIKGYESTGPKDAATELLRIIGVDR